MEHLLQKCYNILKILHFKGIQRHPKALVWSTGLNKEHCNGQSIVFQRDGTVLITLTVCGSQSIGYLMLFYQFMQQYAFSILNIRFAS